MSTIDLDQASCPCGIKLCLHHDVSCQHPFTGLPENFVREPVYLPSGPGGPLVRQPSLGSTGYGQAEAGHPTQGGLKPKKSRKTRGSKKRERQDTLEVPVDAKVLKSTGGFTVTQPSGEIQEAKMPQDTAESYSLSCEQYHGQRRAELVRNTLGLIESMGKGPMEVQEDSQPGGQLITMGAQYDSEDPFTNWQAALASAKQEMKPHLKHRYGAMAACENGTCLCCAIDPETANSGWDYFMRDIRLWENAQPKLEETEQKQIDGRQSLMEVYEDYETVTE